MGETIGVCQVPSCPILIAPEFCFCERHWRQLPRRLQVQIDTGRGRKRTQALRDSVEFLIKGVRA